VSGRVLRVYEESERVVLAGTPLFDIADVGGLEVVVDLLTEQAVQVEPGAALHVTGWGGDETLSGRVRYVEPAAFTEVSALGVEEQRVDVVGDLDAPPQGLGDGFRLDVAIVVWQGTDVLSVPTSALFQRAARWQVFVIEDGRARSRQVEIGRRATALAEVTAGLVEGDRVILYPSDLVDDGVRVTPTSERSGEGSG
jgi:HlyD family secretion protein